MSVTATPREQHLEGVGVSYQAVVIILSCSYVCPPLDPEDDEDDDRREEEDDDEY